MEREDDIDDDTYLYSVDSYESVVSLQLLMMACS